MAGKASLLGILLGYLIAFPAQAQFDQQSPDVLRGRALFLHEWQPNDPQSPEGDGLGPMFNAKSCVACHHQGGIGGGGDNRSNIEILSVLHEKGDAGPRFTREFLDNLRDIHPDFVAGNDSFALGVPLHRFSTTPRYAKMFAYLTRPLWGNDTSEVRRKRMLRSRNLEHLGEMHFTPVSRAKGVQLGLTQRSTPALFGLEEIDRRIQTKHIAAIAEKQAAKKSGIEGRQLGRFGWRGQIDKLDDFVKGACANELGLQVEGNPQPSDPLRAEYELTGHDLDARQTSDMIRFVRSLPRPRQVWPTDEAAHLEATLGAAVFGEIGCAECHVPNVGPVQGVFSDFLVHAMGPAFEDPIPAQPPEPKLVAKAIPTGRIEKVTVPQGGYHGGVRTITREVMDIKMVKEEIGTRHFTEWKTPPLWGVADSAPYLHDGRAATLTEAIAMHGGEAATSAHNFAESSAARRDALLTFLGTLKAPLDAEPAPPPVLENLTESAAAEIVAAASFSLNDD